MARLPTVPYLHTVSWSTAWGKKCRSRWTDLVVPWCTYTEPEIAHVGMYERDARAQGLQMDTFVRPLAEVDRAILDGDDEGFVKIHV